MDQLKQRMRASWMAGDFGQVARYQEEEEEKFIGRVGVWPGARVLDVACGTGNSAIPAARLGAKVTGVDIATNLIEQARARAAAEGLDAVFQEGDAEQLAFPDASFDFVVSVYGAMFAPRPELVASEFLRVCRPGGTIAMGNWTPSGFVGRTFAISARFVPPPDGIPAPVLWGDEAIVRQRFSAGTSAIKTTRRMTAMKFPFPPADVVQFFRQYFGPTQVAFSKLDPPKQAKYAAALEDLWREKNEASGDRTLVHAEYLEVIATRA
jgi:SAM-dependent methyltransferase